MSTTQGNDFTIPRTLLEKQLVLAATGVVLRSGQLSADPRLADASIDTYGQIAKAAAPNTLRMISDVIGAKKLETMKPT